jgi:enamidase
LHASSNLLITNIKTIVSGILKQPILDGNAILVRNGKIEEVGREDEIDRHNIDIVIDANGQVVAPGLIDSHFHPAIGDWAPRFKAVGYLESILHSGITTVISQGELHIAGRPKDIQGIKALALLAKKVYENYRPYGLKVCAGALLLDAVLEEADFKELADQGVRIVPEIGVTRLQDKQQLLRMVTFANKYNMIVTMHCGGKSIPGSQTVTVQDILEIKPHIIAHVNGGPTSPALHDIARMFSETSAILEIVYGGNLHTAIETAKLAKSRRALDRIILGSDAPTSSSGLGTLAIMRLVSLLSSAAQIPPAEAIAVASGNTARQFGLSRGRIEPGLDADLIVMDTSEGPDDADALVALESGDIPAISAILVDGEIVCLNSRFTPGSLRNVKVNGVEKIQPTFEEYLFGYPPRNSK